MVKYTHLNSADCQIKDEGVAHICSLTKLARLNLGKLPANLGSNYIRGKGLKQLHRLSDLTELDLSESFLVNLANNLIDDEGAHILAQLMQLCRLYLPVGIISFRYESYIQLRSN